MEVTLPLSIAKSFAHVPKPRSAIRIGNHSLAIKIGEGRAIAHCTFDVDSEGDVVALMVHAGDTDITNYLSFDQIEEISDACFAQYLIDAAEHNADLAINNWLASQ